MKTLLILLFLSAAGMGAWAWWEHRERTRLEDELAATKTQRDALSRRVILGKGMAAGVVVDEAGPTGLTEKAKELGLDLEEKEDSKKPEIARKPGEKSDGSGLPEVAKMLRDPAMRDTLRAQSEAYLDFEYRDLFDQLGLDEKKREAVLAILKERLAGQTDLGLAAFDKAGSAADRTKASSELAKLTADTDARLKELLGEQHPQFDRFENSQPEREQIKTLASMLKDKSLSLDETTETKLMDAMYETRRDFKFDRDLSDENALSLEDLSQAAVDRYLEQNDELQQQIQQKAKSILNPEQFEVFVKSQESQRRKAQEGLQVLRQMTGDGKSADGRN
jgi:hypothetical protein